jgi:hypothetical protein
MIGAAGKATGGGGCSSSSGATSIPTFFRIRLSSNPRKNAQFIYSRKTEWLKPLLDASIKLIHHLNQQLAALFGGFLRRFDQRVMWHRATLYIRIVRQSLRRPNVDVLSCLGRLMNEFLLPLSVQQKQGLWWRCDGGRERDVGEKPAAAAAA